MACNISILTWYNNICTARCNKMREVSEAFGIRPQCKLYVTVS